MGTKTGAHRISWILIRGPIPERLVIDHLCRNPLCVNVDHMELVTVEENTRRGYSPSAVCGRKSECKNGHLLTSDNLRVNKRGDGRTFRTCRKCTYEYRLKNKEKIRAYAKLWRDKNADYYKNRRGM